MLYSHKICSASIRTRDEGRLSWNQSVYNGSCKVGPSSNTGPGPPRKPRRGHAALNLKEKLEGDLLAPYSCGGGMF